MSLFLMNANATFQRMMSEVVKGLQFSRVHIEHVVMFSKNLDQHILDLKTLVERISNHILKIKLSKCFFVQEYIKLLGQISRSNQGRSWKKVKVRTCTKTYFKNGSSRVLRSRFVLQKLFKDFTTIVAQLHAGSTKNGKFYWNVKTQITFDEFKKKLCAPQVLMYPDFKRPFFVETYAPERDLGAVLWQKV